MAQVSYGTITITDTNDIESIIIEYARNQSTSSAPDSQTGGWSTTRPAWAQGYYIWQRARIHKSGTDASEDEFGTAVCITGSTGQTGAAGRGLTATETKYTNVASGTTQVQVEALAESAWVNSVPSYNSSKPDYWVRIKNTYDKTPTTEYIYYKDNAVGDALAAAAMANSLAQSANENANGAMGQAASNVNEVKRIWYAQAAATPAPAAPITGITTSAAHDAWSVTKPTADESYQYYFYCDQTKTGGGVYSWSEVILDTSTLSQYQIGAISAKVRNYWWDSAGAHIASGTSTSGEINASSPTSSYGYNTLTGLTGISFKYNDAKVVELNSTTPSLDFYQPPTISGNTVTQGKKTMMLSANALRFYDPSDGTTEQAKLDTNGLVLSKGGIKAGTSRTNGFIYLSSANFADTISGHTAGTVSLDNYTATDWRQLIGTNFGVRADGTLYANNAVISGTITVGSGSDLSAGLSDYSTTSETQSYVTGLGYQTSSDVNTIIGQTNVSELSDGSDYTKTTNLGSTTAVQNAAKTASNYLGDTDSNAGVTLKAQNGTTTANTSTSNYIKINTNGLEVFKSGESVALYGDAARIGKTNNSAFYINSNSLQAYYMNGNTRTLYFEVSPTGIKYGPSLNATVATTNQIPTTVASLSDASSYALKTYADDKANAAQAAAETTAQGYADTAEANASYSVEIQVTSIDYTNNSATLVAIPYYQGSTTLPTGVTLSYQWYKNGSTLTNTSTAPTITGATTNTLQLGEGTDFGSSTTNAIYTCVIS